MYELSVELRRSAPCVRFANGFEVGFVSGSFEVYSVGLEAQYNRFFPQDYWTSSISIFTALRRCVRFLVRLKLHPCAYSKSVYTKQDGSDNVN